MKRHIKYTVICKTIPEYSKRDGVLYTCSIGYSKELGGLCRLYPLPITGIDKWQTYELEVERNKYDSRQESWKLSTMARKDGWANLTEDVVHIGSVSPEHISRFLQGQIVPGIGYLNDMRASIGILHIREKNLYVAANKRMKNVAQLPLFEDVGIEVDLAKWADYTKETKPTVLRIHFRDGDGLHDLQLNEWHLYRGIEKFGTIDLSLYQKRNLLLVGNMHQHRSTWIGLGVYKEHRILQKELFHVDSAHVLLPLRHDDGSP